MKMASRWALRGDFWGRVCAESEDFGMCDGLGVLADCLGGIGWDWSDFVGFGIKICMMSDVCVRSG